MVVKTKVVCINHETISKKSINKKYLQINILLFHSPIELIDYLSYTYKEIALHTVLKQNIFCIV